MLFTALDRALAQGLRISGYRTGGGLRAVYLETSEEKMVCQSWKPNVEWSLGVLASLYADHERGLVPVDSPGNFLTGSCGSTGLLDDLIQRGGKFTFSLLPDKTTCLETFDHDGRPILTKRSFVGSSVLHVLLIAQSALTPIKA